MTFSCAEPASVAVTFTDSQGFLQLPGLTSWSSGVFTVALQFRTWNKAGLLLTFDLPQLQSTVWLYLSEARLRLRINKGGRAPLELSAGGYHHDPASPLFVSILVFFLWFSFDLRYSDHQNIDPIGHRCYGNGFRELS